MQNTFKIIESNITCPRGKLSSGDNPSFPHHPHPPACFSLFPDQELGKPKITGLGSSVLSLGHCHSGHLQPCRKGPHGVRDAEGPGARFPLIFQMISAPIGTARVVVAASSAQRHLRMPGEARWGRGNASAPSCPHAVPSSIPVQPTTRLKTYNTPENIAKRQQLLLTGPDRGF